MEYTYDFLRLVIDSMADHIAVIDEEGSIQFVNKSWTTFSTDNECAISGSWKDVNYIEECERSAKIGDDFGTQALNGIRSVIENKKDSFYFEYPCHSPGEKRWFMMRVTPFHLAKKSYFVISHQSITERKNAEEKVKLQAEIDGLTGIPNRRKFDEFLFDEWKRCSRLKKPISLAILDLDHFKLLNDTYGHQSGDKCLIKIGALLKELVKRPGDICARYGGEEFILVLGNTSLAQAKQLSMNLLDKIVALNIPNINSPTKNYLTASIGLAEMVPSMGSEESELISKADNMLYKAKNNGRNRIEN
jgi:diguanylate cyclase (GGDEF)-like protein